MLMLICVFTDEWVDYHLGLGFSDIYIYDNVDDSTPLLDWQKNDRKGDNRIHVIPYPGDMVQVPVYKDCARRVKRNGHTWVTFIDVDEFYVLKKHDNIIDFAKDHAAEGHVTVNWEMYGTSGRKTYELHPVTQRFECIHFTRRRAFVKSLIKVSTMGDIDEIRSPHIMPIADGAERLDTSGIPVRMSRHEGPRYDHSYLCGSADLLFYSRSQLILTLASFPDLFFCSDVAVINHYYYRSHEEYIHKRKRGDVYYGNDAKLANLTANAELGLDERGEPLPAGFKKDDTAWQIMKKNVPSYQQYEDDPPKEQPQCSDEAPYAVAEKTEDTVALCAITKDQTWYGKCFVASIA